MTVAWAAGISLPPCGQDLAALAVKTSPLLWSIRMLDAANTVADCFGHHLAISLTATSAQQAGKSAAASPSLA